MRVVIDDFGETKVCAGNVGFWAAQLLPARLAAPGGLGAGARSREAPGTADPTWFVHIRSRCAPRTGRWTPPPGPLLQGRPSWSPPRSKSRGHTGTAPPRAASSRCRVPEGRTSQVGSIFIGAPGRGESVVQIPARHKPLPRPPSPSLWSCLLQTPGAFRPEKPELTPALTYSVTVGKLLGLSEPV